MRSQAALEFLSTYGWAFLIILVMVGALASFGVLDPSRFVSDRCLVGSPFVCDTDKFLVTEEGFTFVIQSSMALQINSLEYEDNGVWRSCSEVQGSNIVVRGNKGISCSFDEGFDENKVSFRLGYSEIGGETFTRFVNGEIRVDRATFENAEFVDLSPEDCYFAGFNITHGTSMTFYQENIVPSDQSCVSEQRECQSGTLSGSFTYSSCYEATEETYFEFELVTGGYAIIGYNIDGGLDVVIPAIFQGEPVISLSINALRNKGITSVVLSENIQTIGTRAFMDNSLSSIVLPEGLEVIGSQAFRGNDLGGDIVFPSSLVSIGSGVFLDNNVFDNVFLSEGVVSLSGGFANGAGLSGVLFLPEGLEVIGINGFRGNNFVDVVFSSTLREFGTRAFMDNSLSSIVLPEGLEVIGSDGFRGNYINNISIGSNVNINSNVLSTGENTGFRGHYINEGQSAGVYLFDNGWSGPIID